MPFYYSPTIFSDRETMDAQRSTALDGQYGYAVAEDEHCVFDGRNWLTWWPAPVAEEGRVGRSPSASYESRATDRRYNESET